MIPDHCEDALPEPQLEEYVVFKVEATGGKLQLLEVAQARAIDGDRAMLLVAEDKPELAEKTLCALSAKSVKGRKIRMRYMASLTD